MNGQQRTLWEIASGRPAPERPALERLDAAIEKLEAAAERTAVPYWAEGGDVRFVYDDDDNLVSQALDTPEAEFITMMSRTPGPIAAILRVVRSDLLDGIALPRDGGPSDALLFFAAQDPVALATIIVNEKLNVFIANRVSEHAPLDYQGWFWRSVDFFTPGGITVARGDGRVAICQNNKWDYPQRDLTTTEQHEFRELIWEAYRESRKGGVMSEIIEATNAALSRANDFILTLGGEFE